MINSAVKKGVLFPEIGNNLDASHNLPMANNGSEAAIATLTLMARLWR